MKIYNLPDIQTSIEIDAPLPDDPSESDSDIDEIEELSLQHGILLLLFETFNMG